jgi:outer membrane protein OmpA-like peptidoglycan-associated protein
MGERAMSDNILSWSILIGLTAIAAAIVSLPFLVKMADQRAGTGGQALSAKDVESIVAASNDKMIDRLKNLFASSTEGPKFSSNTQGVIDGLRSKGVDLIEEAKKSAQQLGSNVPKAVFVSNVADVLVATARNFGEGLSKKAGEEIAEWIFESFRGPKPPQDIKATVILPESVERLLVRHQMLDTATAQNLISSSRALEAVLEKMGRSPAYPFPPMAPTLTAVETIHFEKDEESGPNIEQAVDRAAVQIKSLLKGQRNCTVSVAGHTDTTGTNQHNNNLSKKRADYVAAQLAAAGVPVAPVTWWGIHQLKEMTAEGVDSPANRRVDVEIVCASPR